MAEQLADKLEEIWREELGGTNLHELFPKDETIVHQQEDLKEKIAVLTDFKAAMGPFLARQGLLPTVLQT